MPEPVVPALPVELALVTSAKVEPADAGDGPDCAVSHCSGAAFWVSEPDREVNAAVTTASVADPASCWAWSAAPSADWDGATDEASECAAAGLTVK